MDGEAVGTSVATVVGTCGFELLSYIVVGFEDAALLIGGGVGGYAESDGYGCKGEASHDDAVLLG